MFLKYGPEKFVEKFVLEPSIILRQAQNPEEEKYKTAELSIVKIIYGYKYVYNPHRSLYLKETKDYFHRCFARLWEELTNMKMKKNIILSDYLNKDGYNHIPDIYKARNYLQSIFLLYLNYIPKITFVRYLICKKLDFDSTIRNEEKDWGNIITVNVPSTIDNDKAARKAYYKRIGSELNAIN
tara:strand:+ start:355 stop:903 length:549 start_codon:yes stop_codon:yes gene_type:complete